MIHSKKQLFWILIFLYPLLFGDRFCVSLSGRGESCDEIVMGSVAWYEGAEGRCPSL